MSLTVAPDNTHAIKALQNAGFVDELLFRLLWDGHDRHILRGGSAGRTCQAVYDRRPTKEGVDRESRRACQDHR